MGDDRVMWNYDLKFSEPRDGVSYRTDKLRYYVSYEWARKWRWNIWGFVA